MVKIWIGEEMLDLPSGTSIKIERNSNMFENEQIRGDYTYPFTIPLTEHNRKILGNIQELSFGASDISYRMRAQFTGLVRYGLMYVENVKWDLNTQMGEVQVSCVMEEGLFYSLVKNKKMKDFLYSGPITVPTYTNPGYLVWSNVVAWANDIANGVVTDQPFVFPMMKWENWTDKSEFQKNVLAENVINGWLPEWVSHEPDKYWTWIYDSTDNSPYYNRMVPMFYLRWILEQLFAELGYELECELFDDADFNKLIVVSNYSITKYTNLAIASDDQCTYIDPRNHVPDMTVVDFLNEWVKPFGAVYYFTSDNKCSIKLKKTIARKLPVMLKHDVNPSINKNYSDIPEIANGINFSYATLDSDQAFNEKGNAGIDLNKLIGTVTDYDDLAPLSPSEDDIYYVANENKYYSFNGYDWYMVSNNMIDHEMNSEAFALTSGCVPVPEDMVLFNFSYNGSLDGFRYCKLPHMNMKGSFIGANYAFAPGDAAYNKLFKGDDMGLHILFYHGLQTCEDPNTQPFPYPYASSFNTAPDNASTLIADWHLGWDKTGGLIEAFYQYWIDCMLNTRKISVDIFLNEAELDALLLEQPYQLKNQNYFIYKMAYAAPHKSIASMDIYKI